MKSLFPRGLAFAVVVALVVGAAGPADAATPGSPLWIKRHNMPADGDDRAVGTALSPDGTTLVVVGSTPGTSNDFLTVAYDAATGTKRWARRYDGPAKESDSPMAVAVTPDGASAVVTGSSDGDGTGADIVTISYDLASGQRRWVRRYNGPGNGTEIAWAVKVTPDGKTVVVFGESEGDGNFGDFATIAYDAETGQKRWDSRHDGTAHLFEVATQYGLDVTPDSATAIITGLTVNSVPGSPGSSQSAIGTVAYDIATGAIVWSRSYARGDFSAGIGVRVSPDGATVIVTGASNETAGTPHDFRTVAYDTATGTKLWTRRYNGPADEDDQAWVAAVTATVAIVTGTSTGDGTGGDLVTIAYDLATGKQLWERRYDGPVHGDDGPSAIGATHDGSTVVVNGRSKGDGTGTDYVTIAYDVATGEDTLEQRYDGPAHGDDDAGFSLAISPDDEAVYVTGASASASHGDDFLTIAYPLG